jgi:hypothetical protein
MMHALFACLEEDNSLVVCCEQISDHLDDEVLWQVFEELASILVKDASANVKRMRIFENSS